MRLIGITTVIVLEFAIAALGGNHAHAASLVRSGCSGAGDFISGTCVDNGSVVIEESRTEYSGGGDNGSGGSSDYDAAPAGPPAPCPRYLESDRCQGFAGRYSPPDPTGNTAPVVTTITSRDLTTFTPATPVLNMEPNGWGILNKPTNFWITAEPHTLTGTLFDRPVAVDFSPTGVHWDFGDGNAWRTQTLGESWSQLGFPELSTTATSNIYTSRGPFVVTATVSYSAVVHIDGRSITVQGEVTTSTQSVAFELFESSSVLVVP